MKRILSLLLVAGMFSIYSCGSGSEDEKKADESNGAMQEAAPAAPAADSGAMMTDTTQH
ncbi:MAG: hypothetical protein JJE25_05550 [Bacteroidia bacterium]|nr:hypothetical protein [Bacteroidia bacterium]